MPIPRAVISYSFLFLPLLFACSGDVYSPGLLGDIEGRVLTFDQFGNQVGNGADIKVTTEGIGRSYEATTDAKGVFRLKNVLNGTYTLQLQKDGYASMKLPNVQHLGGKPTVLPLNCFLYQFPDFDSLAVEVANNTLNAEVFFDKPEDSDNLYLHVFYSSQQGFDPQAADNSNDFFLFNDNGIFRASGRFDDPHSDFRSHLSNGETVYFRAAVFTKVFGGADTYVDTVSGQTVYPNLSKISDESSFVLQP